MPLVIPASLESMPIKSSASHVLGDGARLSGGAGARAGCGERLLCRAPAELLTKGPSASHCGST
jgi:hypothetical protein